MVSILARRCQLSIPQNDRSRNSILLALRRVLPLVIICVFDLQHVVAVDIGEYITLVPMRAFFDNGKVELNRVPTSATKVGGVFLQEETHG